MGYLSESQKERRSWGEFSLCPEVSISMVMLLEVCECPVGDVQNSAIESFCRGKQRRLKNRDNEQTGTRREGKSEERRGERRGRKEGRAVVVMGRQEEEKEKRRAREEKGVGDDAAARGKERQGASERVWQERVRWSQEQEEGGPPQEKEGATGTRWEDLGSKPSLR
jgi:hypothetical protein